RTLSHRPARLGEELEPGDRLVVLDEIQKIPSLLDEVHRLIEQRGIRFVLTGSSARKLRRGGVNLLGGRAPSRTLHPFTYRELGGEFVLDRALDRGLLPSIYFSDDPRLIPTLPFDWRSDRTTRPRAATCGPVCPVADRRNTTNT